MRKNWRGLHCKSVLETCVNSMALSLGGVRRKRQSLFKPPGPPRAAVFTPEGVERSLFQKTGGVFQ